MVGLTVVAGAMNQYRHQPFTTYPPANLLTSYVLGSYLPGARHQVRQQHHGPHGMGLWLPSDARWAGADHLRPVLLHHHLRPHAPRRHRSALCGAHVRRHRRYEWLAASS